MNEKDKPKVLLPLVDIFTGEIRGYNAGLEEGKRAREFAERHMRPGVGTPHSKMGGGGIMHFLSLPPSAFDSFSADEIEKLWKIRCGIMNLPEHQRKKAWRKEIEARNKKYAEDQKAKNEKIDYISKCKEASNATLTGLQIKRTDSSRFRELRDAARQDKILYLTDPPSKYEQHKQISLDYEREIFKHAQVFLMQHDWAAAFKDNLTMDFQLPYEVCAFEFQIAESRIIALCVQQDTSVLSCLAAETPQGWMIHDFGMDPSLSKIEYNERVDHGTIYAFIMRQVAACCIALDAEVAVSEVQREKTDKPRAKGNYQMLPQTSYHVVSLARRTRAPRLETSEPTGRKVRLHFRRGHWRHYEDHKTWIKWMLVGDPDLGFIDKHYKL